MSVIEKDIKELSREELLNPLFIPSIFENYRDTDKRNDILTDILDVASDYKLKTKIKKQIDKCNAEYVNGISNNVYNLLVVNTNGEPEPTIDNYCNVMKNDVMIKDCFKYNEFSQQYQYYDVETGKYRPWCDADDSVIRQYIETKYHFCNLQKYQDAFNIVMKSNSYHPIKEIIESDDWDGIPRIDNFLHEILGCDKGDYTREVSRMIFYGGINRLYDPGCKFDYVPILMGIQGIGKSSIVNWLALEDSFYREVQTIEGKEGMEAVSGGWICEFAELLAMVKAKEVESLKSFITRTTDTYRKAYGSHISYCPRQCIFIGTTNDVQFLNDKTGNRRFLPIEMHLAKGELFENKEYVKNYILNCWREALVLYKKHKTYLVIPSKYNTLVERMTSIATDDDPVVGNIVDYLSTKEIGEKVCTMELFVKCMNGIKKNFTRRDGRDIGLIMLKMKDWKREYNPVQFEEYGRQRYWVKLDHEVEDTRHMIVRKIGDDLD